MNKTKSIVAVIMIMLVTLIGFNSCKNKKCNKENARCEKKCCSKDEKCCDKCNDNCTAENKCCDKCAAGEAKACCKKDADSTACCKDGGKMETATTMYACPMHKEITSDKPDQCSSCGMDLEKQK